MYGVDKSPTIELTYGICCMLLFGMDELSAEDIAAVAVASI